MSPVDPCDPVEAYVRSIRSVLFIDDQFPTFADVSSTAFEEAERARGLWRACTQKGWLCDIDNSPDWTSPERRQRLASCDLLILDLHLAGQDSRPALSIVRELACSETPNLVVVYTADPKLDQAFITVAASARGVSTAALASELEPEIESMEVHWTQDDILAFIAGQPRWMRTYTAACKMASLPVARPIGEVLLERWIATNLGVSPHESLRSIERIGRAESRWFQCGNLFVVVIGKPPEQVPEEEARVVLNGLEAAIKDWAPPWLACLVASSRRSVETGSFRDDADLPPEPLQDGLIRYIRASDDGEERARRAREITAHMLARRFDVAINSMSEQLLQRTEIDSAQPPTTHEDQAQLLHLNAFLCSEPFSRHHLRVGTIFRAEDEYWVCVTPACDMVPRSRRRSIDPWAVELDPLRPMLALRLERRRGDEISVALADAEKGRYLFFWDLEEEKGTPIVAACFNTFTGDPNPRLEQMFALDRASVRNGKASVQRCARDQQSNTTIALRNVDCRVVYQLRTPYAERLAHVVGHHLSRIGVNFLQFGTQDPEGQDRPPYRPVDQSPV